MASLVVQWRGDIASLAKRFEELEKENRKLRKKNPTQRLDKPYSRTAEEMRRRKDEEKKSGTPKKHGSSSDRQTSDRRWRMPKQDKNDRADHHEFVLSEGFAVTRCEPGIDRPVWRIRNGKATLVVYEIWHGRNFRDTPGGLSWRRGLSGSGDRG